MGKNQISTRPQSFAATTQIVEQYVQQEIAKETQAKQLYYHNLDHALAVKRRAAAIFQALTPILAQNITIRELERLAILNNLCGLAHDMVQLFEPNANLFQSRKHQSGLSERATANQLIQFIKQLNLQLTQQNLDQAYLFSDYDLEIIQDAILATVCHAEVTVNQANEKIYSIYQPYLYDPTPKISIIGSIIALADMGTLGIDGVDKFIQDGILIFLEDNPDLFELLHQSPKQAKIWLDKLTSIEQNLLRGRLLKMAKFMVNLAQDRRSRLEQELVNFTAPARQILREQLFIHFHSSDITQIANLIPINPDAELLELINFYHLHT